MEIKIVTNVHAFISDLEMPIQVKIARMLNMLEEYNYQLGMPYSKSLHEGLFELRITGNVHIRLLYCFHRGLIYILHAFSKKSGHIPRKEITLAKERMKLLA